MTDDIHALSGAYAVDALDDAERADFEQHLAVCATCHFEVTSLQEASALLAQTTVLAPSPQLRERVLAGVATVRPLPPVVPPGAHRAAGPVITGRGDQQVGARRATDRSDSGAALRAGGGTGDRTADRRGDASVTPLAPRRRRRAAGLLAAAAATVLIGAGGVVWHHADTDRSSVSATAAVLDAPDRQAYTADLSDGSKATVYRSADLNEAVLVTKGFPAAQSGKEYALWLIHDGTPVPAGVLPSASHSEVLLSGDAATATAAGITLENAGSTLSTPSGAMVASISFGES